MSNEASTYQAADEIDINGVTVTLISRKGSNGIRWTWADLAADVRGESYKATPELAIDDARATLTAGPCRHGRTNFCPVCHDTQM